MRRLAIVAAALVLVAVLPVSAHPRDTSAITELQARVTALEQRVAALESEPPSPTPTPPPATPAPTPQPTPTPVPTAAPACSVSLASGGNVQTALNSTPDGGTLCLNGQYTTTGISASNRTNLTILGNGSTISLAGSAAAILRFDRSDGITVRNLTLQGDNPDVGGPNSYHALGQEFSHGISIRGTDNVELDRITTTGTWGDGVFIGSPGTDFGNWSDHVWIHDSTIRRNGRMGIVVNAGSDVLVQRSTFDEIALTVFDLEPDAAAEGAINVRFTDNTIGTYGHSNQYINWVLSVVGADGATGRDITLQGNTVEGNASGYNGTMQGVHVIVRSGVPGTTGRRQNIIVRDNIGLQPADGTTWPGAVWYFDRVDGVTVSGNTQAVSAGQLFQCVACTGVTGP
jgi:hypothetical protein